MKLGKEIRTGLYFLLVIALFIYGYNLLKGRNMFSRYVEFYAEYENVDGLLQSNPVVVNGFAIGQVEKIMMKNDNSGKVVVKMVTRASEFDIPKNSIARIISSDLLGSKAIEIIASKETEYIDNGDTLKSEIQASLTDEVNRQVLPLKNKAEDLISSIDSLVSSLRAIVKTDEAASKEVSSTFQSIGNSVKSLEKTTKEVEILVTEQRKKLSKIIENVESISSNFEKNNESLSKIMKNMESITDSLVKANVTETVNNASKAMSEASEIMDKINKGEGSIGLLINDDKLYKDLDESAVALEKLLTDMRLNPKRYVQFSVFGGKDKSSK
jgi:phospholipid/cholesterol/gamma-HCH transport system substrate-binding protein